LADDVSARRRAILCVMGASFLFAVAAALIKLLTGSHIPTAEMVLSRSAITSIVMLALLPRHGGFAALRTRRPLGHAVRTLLGLFSMSASFYGYVTLPLATAIALGFAMPLFLTMLSVPLLGERVGWRRATAVLVGLGGVLVMVRPWRSATEATPLVSVAIVLAGVLAWAFWMITIRRLGALGERNVTIVLWYSLGSTVIAAVLAFPVWVPLGLIEACVLGIGGLIAAVAQLLMTQGYRSGEATVVAPFEYAAIIYSTALGATFWGEYPDIWSVAGIAILVGAGLYIWRREVVLAGRAAVSNNSTPRMQPR
jgi:drug/metabolite transporter (DMT)-like permease